MRTNTQSSSLPFYTLCFFACLAFGLSQYKIPVLRSEEKCNEVLRQLITLSGLMITLFYAIVVPKLSSDKGDTQAYLEQYYALCLQLKERLLIFTYAVNLLQRWHFTTPDARTTLTAFLDSTAKVSWEAALQFPFYTSRWILDLLGTKATRWQNREQTKHLNFSEEDQCLAQLMLDCQIIQFASRPQYTSYNGPFRETGPFTIKELSMINFLLRYPTAGSANKLFPETIATEVKLGGTAPYRDKLENDARMNSMIMLKEYKIYQPTEDLLTVLQSKDSWYFYELENSIIYEATRAESLLLNLLNTFSKTRYNTFFWMSYIVLFSGLLIPILCLACDLPFDIHQRLTLFSSIITLSTICYTFAKSFYVFASNELNHLE